MGNNPPLTWQKRYIFCCFSFALWQDIWSDNFEVLEKQRYNDPMLEKFPAVVMLRDRTTFEVRTIGKQDDYALAGMNLKVDDEFAGAGD